MDLEEELFSPLPPTVPPTIPQGSPGTDSGSPSGNGSQPSSRSSSPVVPQILLTMSKPTLGGKFGSGDVVWIGGPPKADFSGPYIDAPPTPLYLQNMDASSKIKGYERLTQGRDITFKHDDPDFGLMAFANVALLSTCRPLEWTLCFK